MSCEPAAAGIPHSWQQHRAQDPAAVPPHPWGSAGTLGLEGLHRAEGAHLEQAGVISASGPGPTSQFTLDCGDRAAPSEPPSSWAILAHLFMPTLVAIDDLAGRVQ